MKRQLGFCRLHIQELTARLLQEHQAACILLQIPEESREPTLYRAVLGKSVALSLPGLMHGVISLYSKAVNATKKSDHDL